MTLDLLFQGIVLETVKVKEVLKLSEQYLYMWKEEC